MKRPRRNHSATFKAKVALAAVRVDKTLVELAEQFKGHPNQIGQWRAELLARAAEVFATAGDKRDAGPDLKTLHAKIGQLGLENDFLSNALGRIGDASTKR
jgi:transposase-like protein